MSSENVTSGLVELRYTLTSDDLLDGLAAQNRSIPRPWYLRWLTTLLTVAVIAVVFVSSALSGNVSAEAAVIAGLVVLVVLVPVVVGVSLLMGRFTRGSWMYRLPVRQIMRGNPVLSQPMQATITGSGIQLSSADGQSTASWTQYPVHAETDRSFVLFASQRRGGAVLVLPKRGLDATGAAALRALLAAHSLSTNRTQGGTDIRR